MVRTDQKLSIVIKMLESLRASIELLNTHKRNMPLKTITVEEQIDLALRDSIIFRFKHGVSHFLELVALYLEDVEKVTLLANTPSGIIRAAVEARMITEDQGQQCIEMIKDRNLTSHIYREEIAEDIKSKAPRYYDLQKAIVASIQKRM